MRKIINIGLLITFPLIYFDMGHDGGSFLGLAEFDMLHHLTNFKNPLLLFIVSGQIAIIVGALSENVKRYTIFTGIGISILSLLAILSLCFDIITNPKAVLTGIPFLFIVFTFVRRYYQFKNNSQN